MMVMLPMRSVLAFTQSTCEMHDHVSKAMENHGAHMMHLMGEDAQSDTGDSQNSDCCNGGITCTGDCSVGISMSFITPSAVMLPALNEAEFNPVVNNTVVFRDLTPPLRPPANLQI